MYGDSSETSDATALDLSDPGAAMFSVACANDPHPVYRALHEQCPVSRADGVDRKSTRLNSSH